MENINKVKVMFEKNILNNQKLKKRFNLLVMMIAYTYIIYVGIFIIYINIADIFFNTQYTFHLGSSVYYLTVEILIFLSLFFREKETPTILILTILLSQILL